MFNISFGKSALGKEVKNCNFSPRVVDSTKTTGEPEEGITLKAHCDQSPASSKRTNLTRVAIGRLGCAFCLNSECIRHKIEG